MAETIPIEKIDGLLTGLVLMMPSVKGDLMLKAAIMVENEAKRVIGTYDYGWPRLSPATVKRKGADTPLLDTGELRDSIEHTLYDPDYGEIRVGTNNPKAEWMEFGTSTIPARSFLRGAAMAKEKEIVEMVGKGVHAHLISGGQRYRLVDHLTHTPRAASPWESATTPPAKSGLLPQWEGFTEPPGGEEAYFPGFTDMGIE